MIETLVIAVIITPLLCGLTLAYQYKILYRLMTISELKHDDNDSAAM